MWDCWFFTYQNLLIWRNTLQTKQKKPHITVLTMRRKCFVIILAPSLSFSSSCPDVSVVPAEHRKVSSCLLMSHLISASILGPVFGNQDQFVGLAIFLDTFRNDLHGMDVSVWCVAPRDWPACFFTGPVFSNYARFHGLAVFIDTYSNDDAMDVSDGWGFTCQHAVQTDVFPFLLSMGMLSSCNTEPSELVLPYSTFVAVIKQI